MKRRSSLINLAITLSLLLLLAGLWQQRINVWDWLRLRGYSPDARIVQLSEAITMNDYTRHLFFVYHAALEDKSSFNKYCRGDNEEQSIVLGCYVGGQGIHVLDIKDERLKGVEEVTAAHETLHAAYARLSRQERQKVDDMTSRAFQALNNKRIQETIELYRQQSESIIPNELHSILGTEVRDLPPELETYYAKYFKDRLKIVAFSEQYEQNFTERKNQIQAYDVELESLKKQIESLESTLTIENQELTADRSRLDSLKQSGQTSAYNASIPSYNQKVARYNSDVEKLSNLIAEFNDIVPKRNAIASEEEELVKAIDSRETVPASR